MLTDLKDIDLKKLSEAYDPNSRDSYISLYLGFDGLDEKFVERRESSCKAILKGNKALLSNFDKTLSKVKDYVRKSGRERGQKGLAVFASHTNDFFEAFKLSLPVENLLVADTSPYIRPLARLIDDYETFGLVLLNSHRAKIYVVSSGKVDFAKKKSKDIMNKHKKGGWSQARFQRLRQGAIDHFMKEVAEDVDAVFSKEHIVKVVIAGPGSTKVQFQEYLAQHILEKLVDTIEIDFDEAEHMVVSRAKELVIQDERDKDDELVARWREEILKSGLAVYGLKETKVAVMNGQVEVLLVSKNHKEVGWICEHCQFVAAGSRKECPYCGGEVSEVDVPDRLCGEQSCA
jgi:peptide chain release factor subunit 1